MKQPAPLALTLHGAGGNARSEISHFLNLANEAGLILRARESRGSPGTYWSAATAQTWSLSTRRLSWTAC